MSALATRHIGNDVNAQAEAVFQLLEEARSVLYLNGDQLWLGTPVHPFCEDHELVALERIEKAVRQGPPAFRDALKDGCRRRRLVASTA